MIQMGPAQGTRIRQALTEAERLARDRVLHDPTDHTIIVAVEEVTGLRLTLLEQHLVVEHYDMSREA